MYFTNIILHASIIDLIIFSKPRLWAFSCCKPSSGLSWARLKQARFWAWPSTTKLTLWNTQNPSGSVESLYIINHLLLEEKTKQGQTQVQNKNTKN